MNLISLYVHVPCATFRISRSREYGKTYYVPPPSTIYGMLLSLVGETNAQRHCGVRLAIAMLSQPQKSSLLRKMRRFKEKDYGHRRNITVEHQEILTDIRFIVWVESSPEVVKPTLVDRIEQAKVNPASIKRFGCLYLGESNDLVNSVRSASERHLSQPKQWLVQDNTGRITLPYWVDHVGSRGTRWQRYSLEELDCKTPPDNSWTVIQTE
ncbi:MAG: type I-MYXAN CRISPR-associated protein Cas5/Cmx5/DevS [Pleurocapsa sp. MO_226.B13]|nr:type I-MYXAN CRISPR-associated protein Cas5/Cmx5/DevS [Pleurocapsa sp. MO_226.B13]